MSSGTFGWRRPVEPLQPARVTVAVDRPVGQVGLQVGDELGEVGPPSSACSPRWKSAVSPRPMPSTNRPPEASCTVAATLASAAGMAGVRVRHAGREPEPLGGRRGERDGDERVADEVLRVGERDAVPPGRARPARPGRRRFPSPGCGWPTAPSRRSPSGAPVWVLASARPAPYSKPVIASVDRRGSAARGHRHGGDGRSCVWISSPPSTTVRLDRRRPSRRR